MLFLSKNSFLAIVMLIRKKLVEGRGIAGVVENAVFSLLAGRHQRIKITHLERVLDAQ